MSMWRIPVKTGTLTKFAVTALVASCLSLGLAAQGAKVSYSEGKAESRTASGWAALSPGDSLAADATIRLAEKSVLEMQWAKGKLTLSQPGV